MPPCGALVTLVGVREGGYSGHLWGLGHSAGDSRGHLPGLPYIQLVFSLSMF